MPLDPPLTDEETILILRLWARATELATIMSPERQAAVPGLGEAIALVADVPRQIGWDDPESAARINLVRKRVSGAHGPLAR